MTLRPNTLRPAASAPALTLALTLTLGLGACASTPVAVQELAIADAAVQRASSTRTTQLAPMELGVAVAKLGSARAAQAAGNHAQARRLADEATLDAQVADLRADTVQSVGAAKESEDAARALRDEITRKTAR